MTRRSLIVSVVSNLSGRQLRHSRSQLFQSANAVLKLVLIVAVNSLLSGSADAQHPLSHHASGHRENREGQHRQPQPFIEFPTYDNQGSFLQRHSHRHDPFFFYPFMMPPVQVVSYTYPVSTYPTGMLPPAMSPWNGPTAVAPLKVIGNPSSPAARLKSLDHQARGDQKMREQKWSEARAAYLSAVNVAPDRAIAHLRLGLCYVAIQRYDAAVREIKRALQLDPAIAKSSDKLDVVFGPESKMICNSILSKLNLWVKEDLNSSDRLFLYGLMLHLNSDPRAHEMLEAALHTKPVGDLSHISLFLDSNHDQDAKGFPKLNSRPDPVVVAQPHDDLRFPKAPIPMP